MEPYNSYLERTNWIKGHLERAKFAAEKDDKQLARDILAEAAKEIAKLNQVVVLALLTHQPISQKEEEIKQRCGNCHFNMNQRYNDCHTRQELKEPGYCKDWKYWRDSPKIGQLS